MYAFVLDHYIARQGTLVEMLREARGCGNARIARLDADRWTPIITDAGSDTGPLTHHGRTRTTRVHRRLTARVERARRRCKATPWPELHPDDCAWCAYFTARS